MKSTFQGIFGIMLLFGGSLWGQHETERLSPEFQSHMAVAQQAQAARDYATAEKEYRTLLKMDPAFAEIHMNLGLVYQLQDRRAEAISEFKAALKLKPTLTGANFFLGVDYCKEGLGVAAIPYLKKAASQNPELVDIWKWLANAQEMTGDVSGEVTTLNRALTSHPRDVDLLYQLGQAYERLGKQQAANLKKAAPNSVRAEQLVAEGYAASNEWPSAVIHFQNALAKAPDFPGLHVELGEMYLRGGKLKQATAEFEIELKQNPRNLRARVRRGEARLLHEELKEALQDWEQALATDRRQAEQILGMRESGFGDAMLEQLPEALQARLDEAANQIKDDSSPAAAFAGAFLASQKGHPAGTADSPVHDSVSCANLARLIDEQRYSQLAVCVTMKPAQIPAELRVSAAAALVQVGEYELALKTVDAHPPVKARKSDTDYWRARCFEKLATAAYFRLYQADPNSDRVHE
ncbi:MAG TPA: tetratricopeptide repeat protein, partial [Terriglobales bacterium]|nr:tetratricopeptide repeat protein [Terriglobales bacterium]